MFLHFLKPKDHACRVEMHPDFTSRNNKHERSIQNLPS